MCLVAEAVVRPVVRNMLRQRAGRIVTLSSTAGERGNRGQVHYAASKAGLSALGQGMQAEFPNGPIKITVLEPGYIESEMTAKSETTMLMVDIQTGVTAMVDAIERERGRAVVPGWPWTPLVVLMKVTPTRFTRLFA